MDKLHRNIHGEHSAGTKDMTVGNPYSLMIGFALPVLLSQIFQQLYNTADAFIVGRCLGTNALAAVTSSGTLIFLMISFFMGMAMGAGVIISRYFGAGQEEEVSRAIHTVLAFGIVSGVILTVVGVAFTPTFLVWMQTDPEVLPEAISYFRYYFLGSLALVILCAYIGYIVHAVIVYSLSAQVFVGISPMKFFKGAFAAMMFAFTSTSSAATLPVSKECADDLGADGDISSFVLPLGSTINMDGTAIYQCVATVFIASCAGIHLSLSQMVIVVVTATLASIGTAGVSGAGMIMLAMVLTAMGIDVNLIMIIYGVDRLFDMGRTCLNVTGDIACSVCVSKWEGGRKSAAKPAKAKR